VEFASLFSIGIRSNETTYSNNINVKIVKEHSDQFFSFLFEQITENEEQDDFKCTSASLIPFSHTQSKLLSILQKRKREVGFYSDIKRTSINNFICRYLI
jgi:hypothetical protein